MLRPVTADLLADLPSPSMCADLETQPNDAGGLGRRSAVEKDSKPRRKSVQWSVHDGLTPGAKDDLAALRCVRDMAGGSRRDAEARGCCILAWKPLGWFFQSCFQLNVKIVCACMHCRSTMERLESQVRTGK